MPSTLTSLAPSNATPGTLVTLTGTGFLAGAILLLSTSSQAGQVNVTVASVTQGTCTVPELPAGAYLAQVVNLAEDPSNGVAFTISLPPPRNLCTLERLKDLMGLSSDEHAHDRQYTACIEMASEQLREFCRRSFGVGTYVEQVDGDASTLMALSNTPVVAVQALAINGVTVDPAEAKVYEDYIRFESGGDYDARLRSSGRVFPIGLRNIVVTYTAGYPTIPGDLVMACAQQAIYIFNTFGKQGITTDNSQQSAANKTFALEGQFAAGVKVVALRYRRQKLAIV